MESGRQDRISTVSANNIYFAGVVTLFAEFMRIPVIILSLDSFAVHRQTQQK